MGAALPEKPPHLCVGSCHHEHILVFQRDRCGAWPEHKGWQSVTLSAAKGLCAGRKPRCFACADPSLRSEPALERSEGMTGAKSRWNTRRLRVYPFSALWV